MKKEHTVNLQCSFCGKHQREVKKLIAGPTVYICDECIGLCNDIIASELEGPETAEARPLLRFRIERLKREAGWLRECLQRFGAEFPEPVRRAVSAVFVVAEDLALVERAWDSAPARSTPSWLGPPLERLTRIEELLDGLRRAVENSVPPERMIAFYGCLGQLTRLREELVAAAPGQPAGTDGGT
jgi:hypothetical protein